MRTLKKQVLLRIVNSYIVDSPEPINISYLWNFGSLLGVCLILQILTGIFLAMHYCPNVDMAFNSVEHIMRDVNNGWAVRYTHANVASFFFIFVYAHIARGLYYSSYKSPRVLVWTIGVIILVVMMATGFLGYVLPYGQMSLWGATVITNLLSAIPVFGQDLVESTYATKIFTCLDHVVFDLACSAIDYGNLYFFETLRTKILSYNTVTVLSVLPTVGTVSIHALKKGKQIRFDKKEYLAIPNQFISFLVGLIDGDGYIQITKTTKGFIAIKLVICLSLEDISTLEYINSVLKLGKITIYRDYKNPICKLVFNKTDLQELIFPLLIYHNIFFLTHSRKAQFDLAMFIFKNDVKLYDKIPNIKEIPTIFNLPLTALDYINLAFFKNWLVGFTNAEGTFCIKNNNDACFQLKQRNHIQLFEAFKLLFNTKRNIYFALAPARYQSGAGQGEKDMFTQFSVSSKTDIQTVVQFFSFSGLHPLIGLKSIQYFKWLNNLRNSYRYKNLNLPQ